ncbi:lasso peptide biosynthesis B2 protein [Desulfosporosinus youngiae]|uniref:lasso peptide biosynthesis B2 protein n=1 Tax=Desulfosporosinus youngiae TaxID=339862 RepID=UPI003CFC0DD3
MHLEIYISQFKKKIKINLLLTIAFFLMGIVRLAVLIIPFRFISRSIGERMAESPIEVNYSTYMKAAKVGWAVSKISQFTPWESKCLVQSITAQILLRLIKIPYTLYLGLAKDESNKLVAHAWLRCGGLILTGAREKDRFVAVAKFSKFSKEDDKGKVKY